MIIFIKAALVFLFVFNLVMFILMVKIGDDEGKKTNQIILASSFIICYDILTVGYLILLKLGLFK